MGGGGDEGNGIRELDQTPTWAVALVCAVIIIISILLEKTLHKVGETFKKRKKSALVDALEKVKAELMILGFISLILTFGQNYITRICIPEKVGNTMLPCEYRHSDSYNPGNHRRLLAMDSPSKGCKEGYVSLISAHGLHQIHIFIFFLAIFHVIYSANVMMLGRLKIREWKVWETEIANDVDDISDEAKYRLTHETSFVKGHMNSCSFTQNTVLFYAGCFFRHIFRSVQRPDYLTLRNGFISVHLSPGTKFNFQKYIKRSLEDDFKFIVGITPLLWTNAVVYLILNVKGWQALTWLSILPLVVILAVGTKLQSIITVMAIEIKEKHSVVEGIPLVKLSDKHFWFDWPELVLHLLHLTLFQNAFEITYSIWITYEFGMNSCFHSHFILTIFRISIGIGIQLLCSYITLPLYALVTQMGSHMKKAIFDDQTSRALMNWHKMAKKKKELSPPQQRKSSNNSSENQTADENITAESPPPAFLEHQMESVVLIGRNRMRVAWHKASEILTLRRIFPSEVCRQTST